MRIYISKISSLIALVIFLCGAMSAKAADISAIDFNGELLGKVIPDGSVINFDNELIGHITADGFVLNNENNLMGGIVPQGIAISVDNSILGKVNNDGSVTSNDDSLLGKALPNGLVVNNNYDIIGAVISPGLVYNDLGEIVGRVSGDGKFYDLSSENTGFVTTTGHVYTVSGADKRITLIGRLITSKMIISSTGKFLGSIAPDGKVVDLKKNAIGKIHANGFVYNADEVAVGHIVENGYAFNLDGSYMGTVSYNGDVINKGTTVAQTTFGNRVINKDGSIIGFTINLAATANAPDGKYLGRLVADGIVVKGRDIVGKIGASGDVIDAKGEVIGFINQTGPVFDYLGQQRANAAVNGLVMSLEGTSIGYMLKESAFDVKEKEIGKVLNNRVIFDNNNIFIGIGGINSKIVYKGKNYTISPYGYVFDETENIDGQNYKFSGIYALDGSILTNISSNGRTDNLSLNDKAKLTATGYFLDKNDKLMGKTIFAKYATDFAGQSLGYINQTNRVVNNQNNLYAKILPNGSIVAQDTQSMKNYGQAGKASLSISINGDYLGMNTSNGEVKKSGEIIGKISSNQYVLDNQGALYGKAISFGTVVGKNCKYLGVVSDNGDARSSKGIYLGMILANNQVVNDSEEVIGYIVNPNSVNGKKGDVIGIQSALGTVLNYKNQNLGCQDIYGKIRNSQGEIVGQIIPYTSAMDFNNKILGYSNLNGKIVDQFDKEIGFVDIDGGIYSSGGEDIGVLFKYTVAFDNNNIYLGRVNTDGQIIADNGDIIGRVNYDGSVITNDGKEGFALYDLYVYDNQGNTVGYIAKNGRVYSIMGEVKGVIYNGFVLDKKQNLIARGARDYDIRDENKKIIGSLNLDGKVINFRNIEIGNLAEDGEIKDNKGKVIAKANPLQYYHKVIEEKVEEEAPEPIISKISEQISEELKENDDDETEDYEEDEETEDGDEEETEEDEGQRIGLAITPGGKYIGDVNNKDVWDKEGNRIGTVGEDGSILDENGNKIGQFKAEQTDNPKAANSKWWQSIIKDVTVSPWDDTDKVSNVGPGGGIGPGGRYNPRRAAILGKLHENRRHAISGKVISNNNNVEAYTGWQDNWGFNRSISTLRVDMSNMITGDKPIPAVLARSIISLGDAPVTAVVERNIYGDMGRNVIIPAGSKVIGGVQSANGGTRFNQESGGVKMDISWRRIIRPDGIAFTIESSITGDAEGRGGGALGYVDEQLIKKYAMPIVGTLATSGAAYMMAANEDAQAGTTIETSKQQAASDAREAFLERMDSILSKIIESKEQIQAVTYIPAGTRIIIYPLTDLWLRTTKDIDKNAISNMGQKGTVLAKDEGKGKVSSGGGEGNKQVKGNGDGQGQKQQGNTTPLVEDNSKKNNKNIQGTGALPPPSADGTGMKMPEAEKEDEGEIDLDF